MCWKCRALFDRACTEDLVTTETAETRREPDKKQTRLLKTKDTAGSSAANGCLVCLHLLHYLGVPARAALTELMGTADKAHSIECGWSVFQNEGSPPCTAMDVEGHTRLRGKQNGDEISCLLQLFPTTGNIDGSSFYIAIY